MTIHTKPLYRFLSALGLIATLAACGSGGGDNKDSTPDSFTFTPVTDAAVSTEVTSSAVTLAGFNQDVSISISGGSYSTGGAYTTTAGTVSSGKSVTVKVTTSVSTNTPVEAVLTVGGVTSTFKVTTKADITPDNFSFTAATGVAPKSVNTSTAITVAGIDIAVPISVTGGEYSINDGAFTSTAGTVSKNQTVKVRGTASASTTTTSSVVLTISDKNASYAITTFADTVAPTAQILFPPPVSMTEGNTILVRGSVSDDYSTVTSVKVNGIAATTADGFKNWQALVPLTASTDTNLIVTTADSVGNKSDSAAQVMIRQAAMSNAFPDEDNSFASAHGLVLDRQDGRNRVLVGDTSKGIISVDLNTAKRTSFTKINKYSTGCVINPSIQHMYCTSGNTTPEFLNVDLKDASIYETFSFNSLDLTNLYLGPMVLNQTTATTKIIVMGYSDGNIYSTTPAFLTLGPLSTSTIPNNENIIGESYGVVFDKSNNRYLVTSTYLHTIFSVDASTGARKVFSSNNTVGTGEAFGGVLYDGLESILTTIQIDEVNKRAIVFETRSGRLFAVDLANGNRSIISNVNESNAENVVKHSYGLEILSPESYALVTAERGDLYGVFAIDLVTGKRVVFSKSAGASPY